MARPKKIFTDKEWEQIESLCNIQCTKDEICSVMKVDEKTLSARIKEKCDMSFSDYYKKHSAEGKTSLRRIQFELAKKSAAMAIFLGKVILGQKEDVNEGKADSLAAAVMDAWKGRRDG